MIRKLLSFSTLALALGTTATPRPRPAAAYPTKPIRLIVPFLPAAAPTSSRAWWPPSSPKAPKWTVVADNKAGAGGTIGIGEAVKAAPTGYDLVMGQKDNLVIGPWLYKNLSWDPTKGPDARGPRGLHPCVVIATSVNSKYKTLADVVNGAKAAPGTITYGSPGNGTSIHLAGHLFEQAAGVKLSHIPTRAPTPR